MTSQLTSLIRNRSPIGFLAGEQVLLDGAADHADRLARLLLGGGEDAACRSAAIAGR